MKIELNLNWSPRFGEEFLAEKAQIAERAGLERVWAGELDLFLSPIEVARVVEEYTSLGCGVIVTPKPEVKEIARKYDICLIPGGKGREYIGGVVKYIRKLKGRVVYAGCSGRIAARRAFEAFKDSGIEPRLMPNYVKREFVDWVCCNLEWEEVLPIGPSLILPSKMIDELVIAAMLVMTSNENFVRAFGFSEVYRDISSLDVREMIANSKLERNEVVEKYEKFLLENFTISGKVEEVVKKLKELSVFGGFVLGDPFFRDESSMEKLRLINTKLNKDGQ